VIITVEDGDERSGLLPGAYKVVVRRSQLDRPSPGALDWVTYNLEVAIPHTEMAKNAPKLKAPAPAPAKAKPVCPECCGTGVWENPASGRKSPCSKGCTQP
jgi:hypothetical protein